MTLNDISRWLDDINLKAQELLDDTAYTWYGGFGGPYALIRVTPRKISSGADWRISLSFSFS